jgi:hypothetical protein
MALSIGQVGLLLPGSAARPRPLPSLSAALAQQFISRQTELMTTRPTGRALSQAYSGAVSRSFDLQRAASGLLSLDGSSSPLADSQNVSAIADGIESLVEAHDDLLSFLQSNASSGTTALADRLNRQSGQMGAALENIGVERDPDGRLSVDREALEAAISDDFAQVDSAIRGADGLAITSRRVARDFLSAPSSRITEPPNPVATAALASYQTAYNTGMLVNLIA